MSGHAECSDTKTKRCSQSFMDGGAPVMEQTTVTPGGDDVWGFLCGSPQPDVSSRANGVRCGF